ncbi:MAG: agmatinase, partial [Vibrio sp.]
FLRLPYSASPTQSNADIVVLGVPFDLATTGRPGARLGPDAIRSASVHLAWEGAKYPWSFDLLEHTSIVDAGDLIFNTGQSEQMSQGLEQTATELLQAGKTLLSLGGDHFVTLPLLRAHAKQFGKMALVHFDAHTDTYPHGSTYDHGTMFFHAPNEGLIDPKHSIQIGIRTDFNQDKHQFNVLDAAKANEMSVDAVVSQIKAQVGDLPVYLTFDIDCLDPAFAPGTGTPVCGGLSSDKVLTILRKLTDINLVGMDVVEVSPAYDHAQITALAGATIGLELMYLWTQIHKAPK